MRRSTKVGTAGAIGLVLGLMLMLSATTPAYTATEQTNSTQIDENVTRVDYSNLSDAEQTEIDEMINNTSVMDPEVVNGTNSSNVAVAVNETTYLVHQRHTVNQQRLYTTGAVIMAAGVLALYYGSRYRGVEEVEDEIEELKQEYSD